MAVKGKSANKNKKKTYSTKKNNKPLAKNNNKKNYSKKTNNTKNKTNNKKPYVQNKNKKTTNYKKKTNNKVKKVKKSVVVKKIDTTVSDTELLDKILEESKQKKLNKKKTVAHKNQVKNKVVMDILKEDSKKSKKVKDDLIITKEIDLADLDEYLTRESQIIERNIDEEVSKEYSEEENIVLTETGKKKKTKKKKKDKKKEEVKPEPEPSIKELVDLSKGRLGPSIEFWNIVVIVVLLLLLIIVIVVGTKTFSGRDEDVTGVKKIFVNKSATNKEKEKEREKKDALYEECLVKEKNELDTSDEIVNYVNDLNTYFASKYRVSIKYVDLKHGFDYSYNADKVYYAASTIKALDGLYIYSKAAKGEINLDDTMTYTSKYNLASSFYMTKHKYGEKISIRDLVRYAITRSDNRAHQMLVDYIGFKNLKEYGLSLGATKTLAGDIFGSINVEDAIIYWKEINNFINSNDELGEELKSYFKEADQNYLNIADENITAIHKYGEYENYYHDIGIVYDENPYIIAILSTEGRGQYEAMIKDINMKILELNRMYVTNREKACHNDVYK